eukprot:3426423-Rhodomonas_salina.2
MTAVCVCACVQVESLNAEQAQSRASEAATRARSHERAALVQQACRVAEHSKAQTEQEQQRASDA